MDDTNSDGGYEGDGKLIEFAEGENEKIDALKEGATVKLTADCHLETKDDGTRCLVIDSMNLQTEKAVDREYREMTGEEEEKPEDKSEGESDF